MSYVNNLKEINVALHDIISAEFDHVNVVLHESFETDEFKHGEYFRYYPTGSELIGKNSSGEDRTYNYVVEYYFDKKRWYKKDAENLIADRQERIIDMFHTYNSRYVDGDSYEYKWHELRVNSTEIDNLDVEDYEHIKVIRFDLSITRFNTTEVSAGAVMDYYRAKLIHSYSDPTHTCSIDQTIHNSMGSAPTFTREAANDYRLTHSSFQPATTIPNVTVYGESEVLMTARVYSGYVKLIPHDFSGAYEGTPIDEADWTVYVDILVRES